MVAKRKRSRCTAIATANASKYRKGVRDGLNGSPLVVGTGIFVTFVTKCEPDQA